MKKQTEPNIKAHLLRGAFYLLLLVAICVIPFALGQRATKQSAVADPLVLGSTPVATLSNSDEPASGTWTVTGSLNTARYSHTATLLPNGMVLVAGGGDSTFNPSASAELYDPASGTWATTGSLNTARYVHTATLLPNGKVLVADGEPVVNNAIASAELYDIGLGFVRPDWQPQITTVTSSPPTVGSSLTLNGSRFRGISQASGGSFQDSSTNYPLVQLRNLDSSQVAFLPLD